MILHSDDQEHIEEGLVGEKLLSCSTKEDSLTNAHPQARSRIFWLFCGLAAVCTIAAAFGVALLIRRGAQHAHSDDAMVEPTTSLSVMARGAGSSIVADVLAKLLKSGIEDSLVRYCPSVAKYVFGPDKTQAMIDMKDALSALQKTTSDLSSQISSMQKQMMAWFSEIKEDIGRSTLTTIVTGMANKFFTPIDTEFSLYKQMEACPENDETCLAKMLARIQDYHKTNVLGADIGIMNAIYPPVHSGSKTYLPLLWELTKQQIINTRPAPFLKPQDGYNWNAAVGYLLGYITRYAILETNYLLSLNLTGPASAALKQTLSYATHLQSLMVKPIPEDAGIGLSVDEQRLEHYMYVGDTTFNLPVNHPDPQCIGGVYANQHGMIFPVQLPREVSIYYVYAFMNEDWLYCNQTNDFGQIVTERIPILYRWKPNAGARGPASMPDLEMSTWTPIMPGAKFRFDWKETAKAFPSLFPKTVGNGGRFINFNHEPTPWDRQEAGLLVRSPIGYGKGFDLYMPHPPSWYPVASRKATSNSD